MSTHHLGYISWASFLANEAMLAGNRTDAGARPRGKRPMSAVSAGHPCCPSVSSEHVFEHLGDAVVAGCGCEVVGGGNRVWMTA